MKKILFGAAVIAMAGLFSCNGAGSGDPKSVLISFFEALGKKDIAAARKLATESSKQMLDLMEMGMKSNPDKNAKDDKFDKDKMEFGEPKIDGDKATIHVKEKGTQDGTDFNLKKEGGSWKVAFDKSMMTDKINEGMDKMKDSGAMDSLNNELKNDTSLNRMMDSLK
jgi:hypothetical protein